MGRICTSCGTDIAVSSDTCPECQSVFEYNEDQNLRNEDRAYTILFECTNCGYEWEHGFKKGDRVDKNANRKGFGNIVASIRRDDLDNRSYRERIQCANCEIDVKIDIKKKQPERFPIVNKQAAIQLYSLFSLYLEQAQSERTQTQNKSQTIRLQGQIEAYESARAMFDHLEEKDTEKVLSSIREETKD